jgi:hypothetical protein
MSKQPLTQDERLQHVVNALWFSANSWVPPENGESMLAIINVNETAASIIGMLDDLHMIPALPID